MDSFERFLRQRPWIFKVNAASSVQAAPGEARLPAAACRSLYSFLLGCACLAAFLNSCFCPPQVWSAPCSAVHLLTCPPYLRIHFCPALVPCLLPGTAGAAGFLQYKRQLLQYLATHPTGRIHRTLLRCFAVQRPGRCLA